MNFKPSSRPPRPTPVTIIVGIKCLDAIVLASDSQITYGNAKRTDGTKVEPVKFKNLDVLIAQSGHVALSSRLIDIFAKMAASGSPQSPDEVGEIAQKAIMQLRNELRAFHGDCSSEELAEILRKEGIECEIMIGFFWDTAPHLYTIDLRLGIYQRALSYFEAIGCGAPLGQYLLAEHSTPNMDSQFAALIATYVVETVKKHDAFCGGPTKVGMIRARSRWPAVEGVPPVLTVEILSQRFIDNLAKIAADADAETKQERVKKIHEVFSHRARQLFEKLVNESTNEH